MLIALIVILRQFLKEGWCSCHLIMFDVPSLTWNKLAKQVQKVIKQSSKNQAIAWHQLIKIKLVHVRFFFFRFLSIFLSFPSFAFSFKTVLVCATIHSYNFRFFGYWYSYIIYQHSNLLVQSGACLERSQTCAGIETLALCRFLNWPDLRLHAIACYRFMLFASKKNPKMYTINKNI